MKKMLALLLSASMALSLAACGGSASSSQAPASEEAASQAPASSAASEEEAPAADYEKVMIYTNLSTAQMMRLYLKIWR